MKKQLSITARRCIIATLLFPLWGLGGLGSGFGLFAQVQVMPLSATYTTAPTVKFRVSWTNQNTTNHPPKVWVIIDYDKVENNVAAHNWQPATITNVSTTSGTVTQHFPRGFFLAGAQTGFSADVTVTLSGMPAQFNWCAYALDYPPNATLKAAGGYDLHGTPPFVVNGTKLGAGVKTFGAGTCITSLTDATGNPTSILPAAPSITLSAGSSNLTATQNAALPALKYTTANASGASLTSGSFPAGVSGSWANNTYTISGTPTATGAFTYTVATTNSQSCTNDSKTGTVTVNLAYTNCVTASISLGTVGFANSATYSRNGITLSAPVTATYCQKTNYAGGSSPFNADCRTNPSYDGDLFSWCMVAMYALQLCPSPWRVPTDKDFMMYANGSETDASTNNSIKAGIDGWTLAGFCQQAGNLRDQGANGHYYTSTEVSANVPIYAYNYAGSFTPRWEGIKSNGYTVRCVR